MSGTAFTSIRTEGALFTPDFLQRLTTAARGLGGLTPDSYHLSGEQVHEVASRAWNRLIGTWTAFRAASAALAKGDAATTLTRERWLLPLFADLGFGRLQAAKATEIDGRSYPVSHTWHHVPLHLVGCGVPLDTRTTGVAGAARTSPHGLVQELLNRNDGMLWGVLSNGLTLRLLRDNRSLTRQAYVEFDLVAMMDGQAYADFVALWLMCHQSRFEGERPEDCWLERWATDARERGTRALDDLRDGVERAIAALGRGFLAHPANRILLEQLRSGALDRQDYYRQLLRVVYRLIFLFVAEDRELLLSPTATATARKRYHRYYSVSRLRDLSAARRGTPHADLWTSFAVVCHALGSDDGCQELGLPALGSFLWRPEAVTHLKACALANADLLDAIRALGFRVERNVRRLVDWRNLGPEELGSVYESLLELHPDVNTSAGTFTLRVAAGHERKSTGSYYTPTSLIECLLDSALDPVLHEAATQPDPVRAILELKVCDPACGSGHFLLAAAHRIANRLATVRTGDPEPAPEAMRSALRDVIGHCLYGVDVNPMAAELCKVNLWLEALEPGRPLSFLDHHIQCGNALLGVTPALLRRGIPDEAFNPIEDDDKDVCRELKRRNKRERDGFRSLFNRLEPWERVDALAVDAAALDALDDRSPSAVREKETRYAALLASDDYATERLLADAWCTAFVQRKEAGTPVVTEDVFRTIERDPPAVPASIRHEVSSLAAAYSFFHWHLAFPEVFQVTTGGDPDDTDPLGWSGGFSLVLGNPPWEQAQVSDREFFADRAPALAAATGATRKRLIDQLATEEPALYADFMVFKRGNASRNHLVRASGRYPLTAQGKINSYALFAEANRAITAARGRAGFIVPIGIATDDTTKHFFQDLVASRQLISLVGFDNADRLFPAVKPSTRFCLVTLGSHDGVMRFSFFLRSVVQVGDPDTQFALTPEDIYRLNPNTRTCPVFRTRRDCALTTAIYERVPILFREGNAANGNRWGLQFKQGLFNTTTDSSLFLTATSLENEGWELDGNIYRRDGLRCLPLYEAKMVGRLDHRAVTFDDGDFRDSHELDLQTAHYVSSPRYWVREENVMQEIPGGWNRRWLAGWQDITDVNTMARSVKAAIVPLAAVADTFLLHFAPTTDTAHILSLQALLNSFVLDYVARQKIGGVHLKYPVFKQLAVVPPSALDSSTPWDQAQRILTWVTARALELSYTSWDLESMAHDVGCDGPPFRWDLSRRSLIASELDAAFFHLYGITRDDVDYIMGTFPIVRKNDEKAHGEYRTKRVILEVYDEMQRAIETNVPYKTRLDPPPADPRVAHSSRLLVAPLSLDEMRGLPSRAWATQTVDWTEAALPILAAVLKSQNGPTSTREVRLASALALEPRLLTPSLDAAEAAEWVRLVGHDAAPLRSGVHAFTPQANTAWGAAVKQLRGTGRLIEDAGKNTWSAGPGLDSVDTTTWPDGRARFIWRAIRQRSVDGVVGELPEAIRAWVNAEAA